MHPLQYLKVIFKAGKKRRYTYLKQHYLVHLILTRVRSVKLATPMIIAAQSWPFFKYFLDKITEKTATESVLALLSERKKIFLVISRVNILLVDSVNK